MAYVFLVLVFLLSVARIRQLVQSGADGGVILCTLTKWAARYCAIGGLLLAAFGLFAGDLDVLLLGDAFMGCGVLYLVVVERAVI